jgi:hypothetical protein
MFSRQSRFTAWHTQTLAFPNRDIGINTETFHQQGFLPPLVLQTREPP